VQLIDQTAIARRQARILRMPAVSIGAADQPLQQPCTARHVE
jgi:hypothetical protein